MANKKPSVSLRTILDSYSDPTDLEVYRAARAYRKAGLSLIPISADLSKRPAFKLLPRIQLENATGSRASWKVFCERHPTGEELGNWYTGSGGLIEYGIAILAGSISGNLEILDLDNWTVAKAFSEKIKERSPGLMTRLVRVKTPRPGLHCYYRCEEISGNQKLARVKDPESLEGSPRPKTVIEIKGEGGYCLAPPSPRRCHPKERCYRFVGKLDFTGIPTITPEERTSLIETARSFDTWESHKPASSPRRTALVRVHSGATTAERPGDDFNVRAEWAKILEPHGWQFVSEQTDKSCTWCRPDKEDGVSATTNFYQNDLLHVFSSNADPFEAEKSYSKFYAYTLLNHGGDFKSAASELRKQGYGAQPRRSRRSRKAAWLEEYR